MAEEQDDPTITDECRLLRRIPAQPNAFIRWDANRGRWGISSQAFRNHRRHNAFSVNLESVLITEGLPLESVLADPARYALASIRAQQARERGQTIQRKPEPDDSSHAHVTGDKPKSVQQELASLAEWVIPPKIMSPSTE